MANLSKSALEFFREQGRIGGVKGSKITAERLGEDGRRARAMKMVAGRQKKRAEKKMENNSK